MLNALLAQAATDRALGHVTRTRTLVEDTAARSSATADRLAAFDRRVAVLASTLSPQTHFERLTGHSLNLATPAPVPV